MTSPRRMAAEQRGLRLRETLDGEPEAVRIWLLGGFRVSVGFRSIGEEEWRLRKAGSLVKLLALAPGHRLHREQVMDLLWPDLDSEAAANNLHHALHVARRILEPAAPAGSAASRHLRLRDERLALCPEGSLWVDVEAFEEAVVTARHALEPAAYRAAIDLYSGELLPEERYEAWAEDRRAQLRGAYLSLLVELAGLYEERGDFGPAIEALGRVVAEEPTHEGAHVGLMRLYALSGRRREALGQYGRLREALFRELGAEPEAVTVRLQEEIWAGTFPPTRSPVDSPPEETAEAGRHNLPIARTSFVGREREMLEVKRLLSMTRLLTLTGVGGSGKTRLALKVASDLAGAYPDGAWLVELAPLSEPELVPQTVARALGVREQPGRPLVSTLEDALRARKMLLVLDNCEHLIEAAAHLVDALLGACPRLRVLATSREALDVAGEVNWVVPSLSVPGPRSPATTGELEGYESARLFMERARYRDPSFVLTSRNVQAVAQICRRLDGIPLAIELAAARVGMLSAEQIAARLNDCFGLLTAGGRRALPRHRTLRATMDWSFELLSEDEQILFRRLSVFAGGFALEAAEEVCTGEELERGEILDVLSHLVDKSLVVTRERGGEARYRLLEMVRQYAREKLKESGDEVEVRRRHAGFFLKMAETAEPAMMGPEQEVWLGQLETDHDNLRRALDWCVEEANAEVGLRLAGALPRFWWARGHFTEGRARLEALLALPGAKARTAARARALYALGVLIVRHADYAAGDQAVARARFEESLAIYRGLGDRPHIAGTLRELGRIGIELGDYASARPLLEESLLLKRELGDRHAIALSLSSLGWLKLFQGEFAAARPLVEEALSIFEEYEDTLYIGICLCYLGLIATNQGNYAEARSRFTAILERLPVLQYRWGLPFVLEGFSRLAAVQNQAVRALRLAGAAAALRETINASFGPAWQEDLERRLEPAREALDEEAATAAWEEGRALTPEQAIKYALSGEERDPPTTLVPVSEQRPPSDEPTERLTRREQEIALLVAQELTNHQIALELVISEHTVATHVRKILKKLGLRSRAQIST